MTIHQSNQHLETLHEIRNLMERSSRFISLSGLSGVGAGVCALVGATIAFLYLDKLPFDGKILDAEALRLDVKWGMSPMLFFLLDAAIIFVTALAVAIFFTTRKARRKGQKIWDKLTQRLIVHLAIPLCAGGIFCIALFVYNLSGLIAPTMLIFYGLALVNAGKYTFNDINSLGVSEIILGCISLFNIGYGLEFWTLGFGLLHILYGMAMYWKYERTA